ncbi:MAG: XylR family transcriptional regulator [Planctomycetales bacterium]|nr:XylR family transcriptional regulator [Planctomycetales bacterium]
MIPSPLIALLFETSRGYGRDVALGIARYARLHGPWTFHLTPPDNDEGISELDCWDGNGVFARVTNTELADRLLAWNLPTVAFDLKNEQLRKGHPLSGFSNLCVDPVAPGRLCAAHLLERGYTEFGFVGAPGTVWSDHREMSFCQAIKEAGYRTRVYEPRSPNLFHGWMRERPHLVNWIANLPKPVGIMACNDEHGLHVLDACREARVQVPREVAVIGVDNDELLCELSDPPLSSVSLKAVEGGFEAAAWLNHLIGSKKNSSRVIQIDAIRVVTRRSTDYVATDDERVAAALALIRTQCKDLSPEAVAKQVNLPRRELDCRFRELLGRSVVAEIQRARLDQAQQLLEETDYPIPKVREEAGYCSSSYMIQVFRRELATTPAKYRTKVRLNGGASE